jgi:hypothetical protein
MKIGQKVRLRLWVEHLLLPVAQQDRTCEHEKWVLNLLASSLAGACTIKLFMDTIYINSTRKTIGGNITVLLTSCLAGLE